MFACRIPAMVLLVFALVLPATANAQAIESSAREAVLIEMATGTVLLDKNAETPMPPASMTKIMTLYMLFEQLANSSLSLEDTFLVSEKAWRMGGSKMFVEVGDQIRVEDLIRGIIVHSGNDASIVVAEGLAGSEEAFADRMTERGRELGLTDTLFMNATGWPADGHHTTAHDLARLAMLTIKNFPEYYRYYSETEFTYSDITQGNRNPLLYRNIGADGLKTGHTEEAGYGLAASAERDGRRLILVVNGLDSVQARADESTRLFNFGFREFGNYKMFSANETVSEAELWLGQEATVPLVLADDLVVTLPRAARREMEVRVVYDGPIATPLAAGTPIARLVISAPNMEPLTYPLLAGESRARLGMFGRLVAALRHLVWGAAFS
ncbi:MAG: D-alanyl-D-alanine carboxypeptidase family protein [Alphaproteobacteria bacterium]